MLKSPFKYITKLVLRP